MHQASLTRIARSITAPDADGFVAPRGNTRVAGLRQVEEFTTTLPRIRRAGYAAACVLVLLALVCLGLFSHGVNVLALYSAGAVVLTIRIVMIGVHYLREEKHAAQAYWEYLDTYSYPVLAKLARASRLSRWSRYEVDRYLSVSHLVW
ncbi:MAG TPA: hypothetical protein DIT28_15415 [Oxalobacteraceae bacterium]|jgi:hypothetical protein|nr:hypothetical protein [Oxalobacteraceae bacterium]HCN90541.1 hypothetical protein [Oxalobacteraceae bacterium]